MSVQYARFLIDTQPVDFRIPNADITSAGLAMSNALKGLNVQHCMLPNRFESLAGPRVMGLRCQASEDTFWNEAIGAPTGTTINGAAAVNFARANTEALRCVKETTHTDWSVLFGADLTAAALPVTPQRFVAVQVDKADASKIYGVGVADLGDDVADQWALRHQNVLYRSDVPLTIPARYVGCASVKVSDLSVRLWINSATTPLISTNAAAGQNASATGRWGIGGHPGQTYTWEGPLGYVIILGQPLHGTAALDTARIACLNQLATLYGVTLT